MKGEEMRSALININTTVMDIQTEYDEESAFIVRYNQVINAYNKYAEEGSPKMEVMVGSSFLKKVSEHLSRPVSVVILALVLILLPFVNFFCLGCIISYLYSLRIYNRKHLRNLSRVQDPFQSFFFIPEMCEFVGKHHAFLDLEQSQIEGFIFNQELRTKFSQKLKKRGSGRSNEKLTVLIYDQYFYDSFYLYKKEFYKTLVWVLTGLLLVSLSSILYLSIFFTE